MGGPRGRGAVEPVLHEEMPGHLRLQDKVVLAQGQADPDRHAGEAIAVVAKLAEQAGRLRSGHGDADGLVRLHQRHRFGYREKLLPI